jgi:Delta7-sterol 5-desaturase
MPQELTDLLFSDPWFLFTATVLFFTVLYFGAAALAFFLKSILKKYKIGAEIAEDSKRKIKAAVEIKRSMISILIFGLQSFVIYLLYHKGIVFFNKENSLAMLWEIPLLFLWNEVHFFISHWLLHRKWFFKNVHYVHHLSFTPTPFSVFSFHWFEAFLLGSVIIPPIILHDFHVISIVSLPVFSILLNVFGHWDYDIFPKMPKENLFKFSMRHSMHHQKVKGNFGFMLPFFDNWFKSKF